MGEVGDSCRERKVNVCAYIEGANFVHGRYFVIQDFSGDFNFSSFLIKNRSCIG